MNKNKIEKLEVKGITLIALVITIIILLILAGISISTLTNTGLFSKAKEAKVQTEIGTEKEQVQLAYLDAKMQSSGERITEEQLQSALDKLVGENKTKAIDDNESFFVKFKESGRYYEIDDSGNVGDPIDIKEDETPGILTGSGTEEEPYIIMSIEDLVAFSNMTNGTGIKLNEDGNTEEITGTDTFSSKYVILGKTLNFKSKLSYVDYTRKDFGDVNNNGVVEELLQELTTEIGFTPINNFSGYFNGNNCEIQNIYINRDGEAGLFVATSNKWIKKIENIGITGSINSIQSNAFGICKYSNAIENCWNKADITSVGTSAGICRICPTIKNCYNIGKVMTTGEYVTAGGITSTVGGSVGTIENCYNKGEIIGTHYTGGIAAGHGNTSTTITNCYNEGDVTGQLSVGGILGANGQSVINCYNLGNIKGTGNTYAGGIVGGGSGEINYCYNKGNVSGNYIGGIVGSMGNNNKIINSYNMGELKGNTVGGITGEHNYGENAEISNCFNAGKISPNGTTFQTLGGILGSNIQNVNINNCYNIVVFSKGHSSNSIGGIVGGNSATITMNKCYYLKQDDIKTAISWKEDDTEQVTACNEISEITADILNDNINNIEHTDEWQKWKMGEDGYPIFE